jgi:hypothetical protein
VLRPIPVEAKIDGPGGDPLGRDSKPLLAVKLPPEVNFQRLGLPKEPLRKEEIPGLGPVGYFGTIDNLKAVRTRDNEDLLVTTMAGRPAPQFGWFTGSFILRVPGDYEVLLKVPETNDMETAKITVKDSNPELDNTRPDFARLYRMASEADEVFLRMAEADRKELQRRLQPPRVTGDGDKTEVRGDKARLYFDLKNAELIPSCMVPDVQTQVSRGPVRDLWDEDVRDLVARLNGETPPVRPPEEKLFSSILVLAVGLLSMEWLIRKLLRLA